MRKNQKMQEEVKTKEVLYKDILKEREEMLERISGYDNKIAGNHWKDFGFSSGKRKERDG